MRPGYQMAPRRLSIHIGGESCLKFGTSCLREDDGLCDVGLETRDVFNLKRSDENKGEVGPRRSASSHVRFRPSVRAT